MLHDDVSIAFVLGPRLFMLAALSHGMGKGSCCPAVACKSGTWQAAVLCDLQIMLAGKSSTAMQATSAALL